LAIKSLEEVKSTRSIRHLLIRGASREVYDNKGKKLADYIKDVSSK
jgi:hypothetical protein